METHGIAIKTEWRTTHPYPLVEGENRWHIGIGMRTLPTWAGLVLLAGFAVFAPAAPETGEKERVSSEFATGHATLDALNAAMKQTLSPEGRFVIFDARGKIVVTDTPERVKAAGEAIENLQANPPDVIVDIAVRTGARMVETQTSRAPVAGTSIPMPTRYLPGRISRSSDGSIAVTPAHPTGFRYREIGPDDDVRAIGRSGSVIERGVNVTRSSLQGGTLRKTMMITKLGKPGSAAVTPQTPDPAFLREYVKSLGVEAPGGRWLAVQSRFQIKPSLVGTYIMLEVTPQLAVRVEGRSAPEIVTLEGLTTQITTPQGKTASAPAFEKASPEFNRKFLGDATGGDDARTMLSFRARLKR